METNIAPGLRFSILDREFKKKLEERANRMELTVVLAMIYLGIAEKKELMICESRNMEDEE